MLRRFTWKEGNVYIFHAGLDAYTVGQVVKKGFILFFNYFSQSRDIKGLNLNELTPLFCCGVPKFAIRKFAVCKADETFIPLKEFTVSTFWISERPPFSEKSDLYLLENLDYSLSMSHSKIIKKLDIKIDEKIIEKYEMINLRTDIGYRLSLCKEVKGNSDPLKDYVLGKITISDYENNSKRFREEFEKVFK